MKLDFAFFPQGVSRVQAYFNFDRVMLDEPEYLIGEDIVQQQCMGFVCEAN